MRLFTHLLQICIAEYPTSLETPTTKTIYINRIHLNKTPTKYKSKPLIILIKKQNRKLVK